LKRRVEREENNKKKRSKNYRKEKPKKIRAYGGTGT
jgi:hypothetical protein